jgi:serine/arginine repetitive matrix protein 2
MYNGVGL